jgi:hypothetical protein
MMKTYLRLILRKIVSALCERWDVVLENMALRYQIDVLYRFRETASIYECRSVGVDYLVNGLARLAGSTGDRARRYHKALAPTGLSILSVGKKSAASARPSCN